MPARQNSSQDDTDFRILSSLLAQPDMSQRELAQKLGISLGGLHYCLKALINKGFVKLDNFQNSQHKFKYAYNLTPQGMAQKIALTGRFLQRKMKEYENLQAEIQQLQSDMRQVEASETKPHNRD